MNIEKESGKGIIFGILGILTLIIAIMGASLAYFTATAVGNKEAVEVKSATVAISYTQGTILSATDLIPATEQVAAAAYAKTSGKCVDDNGYQVCAVFPFSVTNEGQVSQTITGSIQTVTLSDDNLDGQTSEFANLSYTVYEVNAGIATKINPTLTKFATTGSTTQVFTDASENHQITLATDTTKNYEILIWLNELSDDVANDDGTGAQNFEQGLSYKGVISIDVVGASSKITGEID